MPRMAAASLWLVLLVQRHRKAHLRMFHHHIYHRMLSWAIWRIAHRGWPANEAACSPTWQPRNWKLFTKTSFPNTWPIWNARWNESDQPKPVGLMLKRAIWHAVECLLHKGWLNEEADDPSRNVSLQPHQDGQSTRLLQFFAGNEAITLALEEWACFMQNFLGS